MLFASSLRRGLESCSSSTTSNSNDHHHSGQRRRSLLVRRHTCSVLDPSKFTPGAALLAPLGGQLVGQVQVLDPSTDRVIAIKSLLTTPRYFSNKLIKNNFDHPKRGSVCLPTTNFPRSISTSILRRAATQRRRSQSRQWLLGMTRHAAATTLTPALLVLS